jgi:hypothetical protein
MNKRSTFTAIGLIAAAVPTPAAADFYIRMIDGRYLIIPDMFVVAVAIAILLAVIFTISNAAWNTTAGGDLPEEISTPEPAEYYEDQAARARALKRKLDAETELAESFINAKRTRAELDEIEEILGHDKAKRRR